MESVSDCSLVADVSMEDPHGGLSALSELCTTELSVLSPVEPLSPAAEPQPQQNEPQRLTIKLHRQPQHSDTIA